MTTHQDAANKLLMEIARRLEGNKAYMSNLLASYRIIESVTEKQVADLLRIGEGQYARLSLCKRPTEDYSFLEQINKIAAFTSVNKTALAQIIRQVSAVEQFQTIRDKQGEDRERGYLQTTPGFVTAARDKEDTSSTNDDDVEKDKSRH